MHGASSVRPDPAFGARPIEPRVTVSSSGVARVDEQELVEAVLAGQREAFRAVVERESAIIVRACYRILGDLHEAEDVAQEAFVIGYRSLGSWRAEGPLGGWLTRIAVRLAVRRAARRRPVTWLGSHETGDGDGGGDGLGSAVSPDPASLALRAERQVEVRAALARLAEPYRETVALRFFADRTLNEIAEATGRPLGTVKTHLHRGLLRLRELLEEGAS